MAASAKAVARGMGSNTVARDETVATAIKGDRSSDTLFISNCTQLNCIFTGRLRYSVPVLISLTSLLGSMCSKTLYRNLVLELEYQKGNQPIQEYKRTMARRIGYARVSTESQDEQGQVEVLKNAGCALVFHERISTRTKESDRPQLQACLAELSKGDTLVLAKLDRLGRSQVEVVNRLHSLQQDGVYVETLDGLINTKGLGKMAPVIIGLLTGLAEVERELIRERTLESIAYRRSQGKSLGGRPKSYTDEQVELVLQLRDAGHSYRKIAKSVGLSLGTVQRLASP
jgi:DNA invertase Pin-like site-specific DNA recombinase